MKLLIPISLGELYDKITILEIKLGNITDEIKRANILKELGKLQKISKKYPIESDLYLRLKQVNIALWNIEDDIRKKEANKQFDEFFIFLARSVYIINDKRSAIKREINLQYNCDIIEEKSYQKY
jgi:hypothetical protein